MPEYFFRLDDVCPGMDEAAFDRCLSLFGRRGVKPLIGVVPDNRDPKLRVRPPQRDFWDKIKRLADAGSVILALHGLDHAYTASRRSLLYRYGIGERTEFAGLPYAAQADKIRRGLEILRGRGLEADVFMAPNHSFDRNTLRALADAGVRFLSDGVGLYPFKKSGVTFLPQLSGRPRRIIAGSTTICLHPNTMAEPDFDDLERFLKSERVSSFDALFSMAAPWFAPPVNGLVRIVYYCLKKIAALRRARRRPVLSRADRI